MDHHNTTGHEVSLDNFTIVGREDNNIARNIREAIFIRVNDPSLMGTLESFNYHTSGMRCWQNHLSCISNNAIPSGMVVTLNPPTSQMVVTINPPTTFTANNIRQGGKHKPTTNAGS